MFWLVAFFSSIAGVVALYGLILIARGLLGESVRLRRRNRQESPGANRRWVLLASGAGLVAAALVFGIVALQQVVILEPDISFDTTITGIAVGVGLVGAAWLIRSLIGDRPKGRRRCPKCWHSLEGTPGLRCPECGQESAVEKSLLRARRSKLAIALAFLLTLAAPLGLVGQAYLSEHEAEELVPYWVLLRALDLPEGELRDSAIELLQTRVSYAERDRHTLIRFQRSVVKALTKSRSKRWAAARWEVLEHLRSTREIELGLADWEQLTYLTQVESWTELATGTIEERRRKALVAGRAALTLGHTSRAIERVSESQRLEVIAAFDRIERGLAGVYPESFDSRFSENLSDSDSNLVIETLRVMPGKAARPFFHQMLDLIEHEDLQVSLEAALQLRVLLHCCPDLWSQFQPVVDSNEPHHVFIVANMLRDRIGVGTASGYWRFDGSDEWLRARLADADGDSRRAVISAALRQGIEASTVFEAASAWIEEEPERLEEAIPSVADLQDADLEYWLAQFGSLRPFNILDASTLRLNLQRVRKRAPEFSSRLDQLMDALEDTIRVILEAERQSGNMDDG